MQIPYCSFEETGNVFKDRKIYKCSYCGLTLALDDPKANMMCFKRHEDMMISSHNIYRTENNKAMNIHTVSEQHFQNVVQSQVEKQSITTDNINLTVNLDGTTQDNTPSVSDHPNLCSKEQIESRLKICNSCEHFKNNSCLLCGCVVVRDANFNNKLAHKTHSCPINKWGPITD